MSTNFANACAKTHDFIRNLAHHETGFWFTVEQLIQLLGKETDNLLVKPLDTYTPSAYSNLDSYDRNVIGEMLCKMLYGQLRKTASSPVAEPINGLSAVLTYNENKEVISLPEKIHTVEAVHNYFEQRKQTKCQLAVSVGEFPDEIELSGNKMYLKALVDFLLEPENAALVKKRMKIAYEKSLTEKV